MRVFEVSDFWKEWLYSKQLAQAEEFQEKLDISEGDILTNDKQSAWSSQGNCLVPDTQPWYYDPIEAYQVRLFIWLHTSIEEHLVFLDEWSED